MMPTLAGASALLLFLSQTATVLPAAQGAAGPYTVAQAEAGALSYAAECARCHGSKLQGGFEEPPLAGERFMAKWETQTTHDLLNFIATRMPPQRPGFLGEAQNLELVAFILRSNNIPSGPNPMTRNTAVQIGNKQP